MFPLQRNRRLRTKESIRSLVRETSLNPQNFMLPMFVTEGKDVKFAIPSMPGIYRHSLDNTIKEVKRSLGFRNLSGKHLCKNLRSFKR